jgi:uncharacterized protein (TIRG00374 family)
MKKYAILAAKIAVSIVLLYLILKKIDIRTLKDSLGQGRIAPMLAGAAVGVIFNLVKFLKWHCLIQADSSEHSYWDGAKSYMIGNALGVVTPMRAGDLGRALYFEPRSRPRVIGFTMIDRALDLVAVILFCVVGAVILVNPGFGLCLAAIGAASLVMLYNPMWMYRISNKLLHWGRLGKKLVEAAESLTLMNKRLLSISLSLSFLAFFLIIIQFFLVISAFDDISFLSACLATPLVTLSSLVPITFMGLGVREGFAVYLFSMLGISSATAFFTAFLCFFINNVSTGIIGAFFLAGVYYRR